MSKQVRNIIIMVIVLLFLVGGLIAAMFLLKDSKDDSSDSSTASKEETFTVIDKTTDSDAPLIKEIVFTDKGTRVEEADEDGENSSSNSSSDSSAVDKTPVVRDETEFTAKVNADKKLVVTGYEALPIDSNLTTSLGSSLTQIISSRKFDNASLADFGLEKPHNITKVVYHDDSSVVFNIGNKTPTGTGYYINMNEEKTVYIVTTSVGEALMKKDTDFIGTSLITPPETSGESEQVVLRNLELSGTLRKDKNIEIRIANKDDAAQYANFSHIMTKPVVAGVDSTIITSIATSASSLTALSVHKAKPSEADLKETGLDNPYSVCMQTLAVQQAAADENSSPTMSKDKSYTIKLGKKNADGNYYAMIDGIDVIYLVSESTVPWAEKTYGDFMSNLLFLFNIQNVKNVKIKEGAKETVFNLEHNTEETDSDKNLKVTVGGKQYDASSFRTLYRYMMSISRYGDVEGELSGEAVSEIEIIDLNGKTVFKCKFYNHNASLMNCDVEGVDTFTVQISKYKLMMDNLAKYLNGEILAD